MKPSGEKMTMNKEKIKKTKKRKTGTVCGADLNAMNKMGNGDQSIDTRRMQGDRFTADGARDRKEMGISRLDRRGREYSLFFCNRYKQALFQFDSLRFTSLLAVSI